MMVLIHFQKQGAVAVLIMDLQAKRMGRKLLPDVNITNPDSQIPKLGHALHVCLLIRYSS